MSGLGENAAAEPRPATETTAHSRAQSRAQSRAERRADTARITHSGRPAAMMSAVPDTSAAPADPRPIVAAPTVGAGLIACAALAAGAAGGTYALAAVLTVCGLVLACGWPILLDLPRPPGSSAVLLVGVVGIGLVTFLAERSGGLRWLVTALAVSLIATFLHELLRTDGRRSLVTSIAGTVFGLAVLAVGAFHINALVQFDGAVATYAAAAGVAVGLVIDFAVGRTRLGEWCLPIGMVVAGAAGTVIGLAADVTWNVPMVTGLVACGIAHALRRVTAPLPRSQETPAQLAIAVAGVLFVGVVPFAALWLLAR